MSPICWVTIKWTKLCNCQIVSFSSLTMPWKGLVYCLDFSGVVNINTFSLMNLLTRHHLLLLNLFFTCGFLVHVFTIGFNLMHPDYPSIRVYEHDLKQIDFPLSFKLCVTEQENSTERYRRMGYADEYRFFAGKSRFEEEVIGWSGHSQNGSTLFNIQG